MRLIYGILTSLVKSKLLKFCLGLSCDSHGATSDNVAAWADRVVCVSVETAGGWKQVTAPEGRGTNSKKWNFNSWQEKKLTWKTWCKCSVKQLKDTIPSRKKDFVANHFCHNAAHSPYIHYMSAALKEGEKKGSHRCNRSAGRIRASVLLFNTSKYGKIINL